MNIKLSQLIYGTFNPAMKPCEKTFQLLDEVVKSGIYTFDTARVYWNSENTLGKWMESRSNRADLKLISKCGHPSMLGRQRANPRSMGNDLRKSLSLLKTDYIDIYILHRDDPKANVGPIIDTFNDFQNSGKIGEFGVSNWTHQRIEEANEYAYKNNLNPITFSSPNFSLAEQCAEPWGGGSVSLSGDNGKEARDWYLKNNMPVIAYSCLGRGLLSGRLKSSDEPFAKKKMDPNAFRGYGCHNNFERLRRVEELANSKSATVAQISLAWLLHQDINVFPLFTTTNIKRLKSNVKALDIKLSSEEIKYLDLK